MTMMKKILLALTLLLAIISHAYGSVFIKIRSANDWEKFRNEVSNSRGQYDVDASLEVDITTVYGIGVWENTPYRGTFAGNGHTLNVDIRRGDNKSCALFCYVKDATIQDLHVTGTISGGMHSAGLIGSAVSGSSNITVDRVWVSTEVTTTYTHAGGIIGHSNYADVYMNDCRFDGRVNTNRASNSFAGEIIGWCNGGSWTMHRVYDQGWPNAYWMFFCIDWNAESGSWSPWGDNGKSSLTVTHHGWTNVPYYNKSNQDEVVNLMNAEQADSWMIADGKAVPVMRGEQAVHRKWTYLSKGSTSGKELSSGYYYVTRDLAFSNSSCQSGLTIVPGATVHIYIPKGITLKATGGNASGQKGAGAGIFLPSGSTLFLEGKGRVEAQGGNAANGGYGGEGSNAGWDGNNYWSGTGGNGGYGGGGAGAGIGTHGADGGNGGNGASSVVSKWSHAGGYSGNGGHVGGSARKMGSLYVETVPGLELKAAGGAAGTAGGGGGNAGKSILDDDKSYNYCAAGGGGGGGGGFGGAAKGIGTGGPGGGGGGGGASGNLEWCHSGYYVVRAPGGKGGKNADGSSAGSGAESILNHNAINSGRVISNSSGWGNDDGWVSKQTVGTGGSRGDIGTASAESKTDKPYLVQYNVMNRFNGTVEDTATYGYQSNTNHGTITVTIPTPYTLGLIKQDKYVSSWNTSKDGNGTSMTSFDKYSIGSGTTQLYGQWNDYKNIFPNGKGTAEEPFIIEGAGLLALADYVNAGGNTRNVYFHQKGDILVSDVLTAAKRGDKWTAIGHTRYFEGDYDGGGNLIYKAQIDNVGSAIGIFGKVTGAIHNLGVEKTTISTGQDNVRCGAIAGMLDYNLIEGTAGQMRDCYAASVSVSAPYAGCLVGEMAENTFLSHCHESGNTFNGNQTGGFCGIVHSNAKVDLCFTKGGKAFGNDYKNATRCESHIDDSRMTGGEITWLLNDKTAQGVTWYQDLAGQSHPDAYPVLNYHSSRVYSDGVSYSNKPLGLYTLPGKGTPEEPFLISSKDDLEKIATYCNAGNKSTGIHFLQTADIDLQGKGMTTIGDTIGDATDKPVNFGGYYDGGGHSIRNGQIKTNGLAGIFGVVTGTVTRLGVEKTTIQYTQKDMRAGGIAARLTGNGKITNCFVNNCTVTGGSVQGVVGGIVSDMFDQAEVSNCLVYQTKVSATRSGHICGDSKEGNTISVCYTDGSSLVSYDSHAKLIDSYDNESDYSLATGEIAYHLNNRSNTKHTWYQTIGQDMTPVLADSHSMVFEKDGVYTNDLKDIGRLGRGTKENPYKVKTSKELEDIIVSIEQMKRSDFYILQTADIDLANAVLSPIGTAAKGFTGHYDGGGHVIRHANVRSSKGNGVGLFSNITGVVERLGIENSTFLADANTTCLGALAGRLGGKGVLRDCYVKECTVDFNLTPDVVVGALVGEQADTSAVVSCYGYKNAVTGQNDDRKHYGYLVGNIGSNATVDYAFTDGPSLCADGQSGARNMNNAEKSVADSRFMSGELCYLLNSASQSNKTWGQFIRTDSVPGSNDTQHTVYRHTLEQQTMYTNSQDMPQIIFLTLVPNYEGQNAKKVKVFRNDARYFTPNFKLEPYAMDRQHYYLNGWNTKSDGKGTYYPTNGELLLLDNLMLYAMWDMTVPAKTDKFHVALPKGISTFKVYDNGGPDKPYGQNYKGKLTLIAPDNTFLQLSGTITTEAPGSDGKPGDYLAVYDGSEKSTVKLTNEKAKSGDSYQDVFFSAVDGVKEDIGRITSGKDSTMMTLEFVTNAQNNYSGLDLTVTVLPDSIRMLGAGTKAEPFKVKSVADLRAVDNYMRLTGDSKIYIVQTADIDMQGEDFTPMASGVKSFEGHYDGGGHVIRNGKIKAPLYAGFFTVVTGTVTRLGMENMTVNYEQVDGRSGAIAASIIGNGEISYCYVKGSKVTNNGIEGYYGQGVAGAIVSEMYDQAAVKSCYSLQNTVTATRAAHICADTKKGTQIDRCYTDGDNVYSQDDATVTASEAGVKAERFASGEVCYLLNDSKSDSTVVWHQTLGTDSVPVPSDSHATVYRYLLNDQPAYSNTRFDNPQYDINSREDFVAYAEKAGDIHLRQDINLGEWNGYHLRGNFDGGGHTITYSAKEKCEGLFYRIHEGASVRHLRVEANIVATRGCGAIATNNEGAISDCHFRGSIVKIGIKGNCDIAGIALKTSGSGTIDHCSATGSLTLADSINGNAYPICSTPGVAVDYCTWVSPTDPALYKAQTDSALNVQADYPVYTKGILDVTKPVIIAGTDTIAITGKHLEALTIVDGQPFTCSSEVTVNSITYKRRGTNGANEPWVLPFNYTIDASMLNQGVAFYRFYKDSLSQIQMKQISGDAPYQVDANEPLAFRTTGADELSFQMKRVKDGSTLPMTIKMPTNGIGASMASMDDVARVMVTYDSIAADRAVKELMYVWSDSAAGFILSDGAQGIQPFRYYLQYTNKEGDLLSYERTEWARKQQGDNAANAQALASRRTAQRAPLSAMTAQGWQALFLDPRSSQVVTDKMCEDYDILALYELYDVEDTTTPESANMAVKVVYVPVEAGMKLYPTHPLLVRAKQADAEPLVTEQAAVELDSLLTALAMDEEISTALDELHVWCATFNGRYDVWPMALPENDYLLNAYGALTFTDSGTDQYFYRVPASDGYTMKPMSYCFTAYDARTFKKLPLKGDRIEIVVLDPSAIDTGIDNVQRSTVNGQRSSTYNLQGQKVGDSYRGIVIQNGRKVVRR